MHPSLLFAPTLQAIIHSRHDDCQLTFTAGRRRCYSSSQFTVSHFGRTQAEASKSERAARPRASTLAVPVRACYRSTTSTSPGTRFHFQHGVVGDSNQLAGEEGSRRRQSAGSAGSDVSAACTTTSSGQEHVECIECALCFLVGCRQQPTPKKAQQERPTSTGERCRPFVPSRAATGSRPLLLGMPAIVPLTRGRQRQRVEREPQRG